MRSIATVRELGAQCISIAMAFLVYKVVLRLQFKFQLASSYKSASCM